MLLQNSFSSDIFCSPAYTGMLIFCVHNPDGPNEVRLLRGILPLEPSVKYLNYRVSCFAWGYGGAGPSQLAFALILHFCGAHEAFLYHNAFKWDVLMHTDTNSDLFLQSEDIKAYVAMKKAQSTKWGKLYWKWRARHRFTHLFYLKFIMPLELGVREPEEPLTEDEFFDLPFLPPPSLDF